MNRGMIEEFYHHTSWLYLKFFENRVFFIDFWSFAHLWAGTVLFTILLALPVKRKWLWLTIILVCYEIFEILFLLIALNIFLPETFKDQLSDLIFGLLGGGISYLIFRRKTPGRNIWPLIPNGVALFSSETISFVWVGSYQYHYSFWLLNTPGLNYWAYLNWIFWGYLLLRIYCWLKGKTGHFFYALPVVWSLFVIGLLGVEAFGYHILNIHEDSLREAQPLVFGLIHGNLNLHLFYLLYPLLTVGMYEICAAVAKRAKRVGG